MGCELSKLAAAEYNEDELMDKAPPPVDPRSPLTAKQQYCMLASWKGIFRAMEKTGIILFVKYSPNELPHRPNCGHDKRLKCKTLTVMDLKKFHEAFYKKKDKLFQDSIILKCCNGIPVKRRNVTSTSSRKTREFTIKYHIHANKKLVPVCQKTFLKCLNITKYRVQYVISNFFRHSTGPVERRGGNHKAHLFNHKRDAIKEFINTLKCSEAHYCRGSSAARRYLPSTLNINKLYKMFIEKSGLASIKRSYFRTIFNTNYNLGFGSPRTDVCSTCLKFTERFKIEKDESKRNDLRIQQRIHRLRAQAFFSMLKEKKEGLKTLSFDCQKNLPLPKVPDQSCYYSRQLYLYNATVVEGSSKDPLTKNNVFCYLWTEDIHAKGSNEIASVVYDRLNKTDLSSISHIRLVADGCVGQNKNTILLGMLSKWILSKPQIKSIEVVFPVTGHSFMPADRVFGNIEKDLRRQEVIISPADYIEIIKNHASTVKLDTIEVFDWKKSVQSVIKATSSLPFKVTLCKRFLIKRSKRHGNVLIKGEPYYKSDVSTCQNICKKNKQISDINPAKINTGLVNVKPAKLEDVKMLLKKHFGDDWNTLVDLEYYANILSTETLEGLELQYDDESICEPHDEPPLVSV